MLLIKKKRGFIMKDYFTIDDLATMTMLSTRTLRNYIKLGFLEGEKPDGIWKFTEEEIGAFLKNDFVRQSIQSKKNGIVFDFMANDVKQDDMVCSIYDYNEVDQEEADKICTNMLGLVNSNQYGNLRFSFEYNDKKKMVRVILTGSTNGIHSLMNQYVTM
jgi:hypothetical protein